MRTTQTFLGSHCPWCGLSMNGQTSAHFEDHNLRWIHQTVRLGGGEYTWHHREDGCFIPALSRLAPQTGPYYNRAEEAAA